MEILFQLRQHLLDSTLFEAGPENRNLSHNHRALFPSAEWGTKSWSYWILEELLFGSLLYELDQQKRQGLRRKLNRKLAESARSLFTWHSDTAFKFLLFEILTQHSRNVRTLIIPEVGPCGFDLMIGKMAGYKKFVVYDANKSFLESCRSFWGTFGIEYVQNKTQDFDFSKYAKPATAVILPDWSHDDINERVRSIDYKINYVQRNPYLSPKSMMKKNHINRLNYDRFYEALLEISK